jgi:hypothetical protein
MTSKAVLRVGVLVGLLAGSTLVVGCQGMTRAVAHMYGYKGDIYASPCGAESLRAGYCVVQQQGGK